MVASWWSSGSASMHSACCDKSEACSKPHSAASRRSISLHVTSAIQRRIWMAKFIDFHPGYQIAPERIALLRQETVAGKSDQYGVRQLELYYSPDGKGVYCLLEAPDEVAVRN